MNKYTSPADSNDAPAQTGSASHNLEDPEVLRTLLIRLHKAGHGAWRTDREAAKLMRYTAVKYRPLARKHGLDPWEIASAAFEAMLAPSIRKARNPWAVVTRAVQITCGVELRAAGMLVSSGKVRHTSRIAGFHDAIRFAEREHLADYHPAFAVSPAIDNEDDPDEASTRVAVALWAIVELFASAGWDAVLVADCVEHVSYRLADLTSRANAVEVLRRDHTIWVMFDIPPRSWSALLRLVLGHPDKKHTGTPTGDGVLLRLLNDESLDSLRSDTGLLAAIWAAKPRSEL